MGGGVVLARLLSLKTVQNQAPMLRSSNLLLTIGSNQRTPFTCMFAMPVSMS